MNDFIKITGFDDTPIYIKKQNIVAIYIDDDETIIELDNNLEYSCKETPEEVLNLLKD